MSGIYKEGYYFGDNGNGHNIKSNGTDQYPRESLNFSGFDLSDDPTNDETDVKAHRLSSSELDEILSDPIPPKPTELPVLFDETGAERIVGWYKYADGTKKPVYQKTFTGLTTPSVEYPQGKNVIDVTTFNAEDVIRIDGFMGGAVNKYNVPINIFVSDNYYLSTRRDEHYIVQVCNGWLNRPEVITLQYIKTTDQPI